MTDTRIKPIEPLEGDMPPKGTYVLLVGPRRVPPHLALIRNGFYYSLSVKGVEVEKDASEVLRALERKGKEAVLLGISSTLEEDPPSELFLAYKGSEPPLSSCLGPIVDFCGFPEVSGIRTVHDLIVHLEASEMLDPPHLMKGMGERDIPEEIRIPAYEEADVRAYLDRYYQGSSQV